MRASESESEEGGEKQKIINDEKKWFLQPEIVAFCALVPPGLWIQKHWQHWSVVCLTLGNVLRQGCF